MGQVSSISRGDDFTMVHDESTAECISWRPDAQRRSSLRAARCVCAPDRLGLAEVCQQCLLEPRLLRVHDHQDVGRLHVAVDDAHCQRGQVLQCVEHADVHDELRVQMKPTGVATEGGVALLIQERLEAAVPDVLQRKEERFCTRRAVCDGARAVSTRLCWRKHSHWCSKEFKGRL